MFSSPLIRILAARTSFTRHAPAIYTVPQELKEICFTDYAQAYEKYPTSQLLKALAIFKLCTSQSLVQNAEKLIETSRNILGDKITFFAVKSTLFERFCPGVGDGQAMQVMRDLSDRGIGSVFDWAPPSDPSTASTSEEYNTAITLNMQTIKKGIQCATLDKNAQIAAVKLTTITNMKTLTAVSNLISSIRDKKDKDSILEAELGPEDKREYTDLKNRLESLAEFAIDRHVCLFIDAEESELQPAINHVVLSVMEKTNKTNPWIWNTYQCYLQDTHERLNRDLDFFLSKGLAFGVKLVRGAYLKHERDLAERLNIPLKTFGSQEDTDNSYNEVSRHILHQISRGNRVSLCLATHNQHSVESSVRLIQTLGLENRSKSILFAQLYGMKDYLTNTLSRNGFNVVKCLVFGEVGQVIPYLIRRAQENSSVLKGGQKDIEAIKAALKSRFIL